MRPLAELLRLSKQIRVIGFDDAPFEKVRGAEVKIAGVICSNTRFEGMLWGASSKDGNDATQVLIEMLQKSKFYQQTNLVLTDGIAIGGFNMIDLPLLSQSLDRPCIAVMRRAPNLEAVDNALKHFNDYPKRKAILINAGEIYQQNNFIYQVAGCDSKIAAKALAKLTDNGNVPEALRLAHLVGSAIMTGQSSSRA